MEAVSNKGECRCSRKGTLPSNKTSKNSGCEKFLSRKNNRWGECLDMSCEYAWFYIRQTFFSHLRMLRKMFLFSETFELPVKVEYYCRVIFTRVRK